MADLAVAVPGNLAVDREPWSQQPREGEKAFKAFTLYREQAPPRRLQQVADEYGCSLSLINRWSGQWSWVARAHQYDILLDAQRVQNRLADIKAMNERHSQLAKAMSSKLAARIKDLDPDELSPGQVANWLATISAVERLAQGEATERIDRGGTGDINISGGNVAIQQNSVEGGEVHDIARIAEVLDRLANAGVIPRPDVLDVAGTVVVDDPTDEQVPPEDDFASPDGLPDGASP